MIAAARQRKRAWTQEAIEALPEDGYNHEIVNGRVVMSPKNDPQHGEVCARLLLALGNFVREHRLGVVWDSSTGFWMHNENGRAPDISFVAKDRVKHLRRPAKRFFRGAPDLAVEVLAASNTAKELRERLEDFFASGTRLAWVIDVVRETVHVYHSPTDRKRVADVLAGEDVLPGFCLPIEELFRDWDWS